MNVANHFFWGKKKKGKIQALRNFTGKFQWILLWLRNQAVQWSLREAFKNTHKSFTQFLPKCLLSPNHPKLKMKLLCHKTTQTTSCKGLLKPEHGKTHWLQRALHYKCGFLLLPGSSSHLHWSLFLLCQCKMGPQKGASYCHRGVCSPVANMLVIEVGK